MFLHNDKELFRDVIYSTATEQKLPVAVVEKDYYVTMLLRKLSQNAPECVFKGGTSISKCYHAIDRFSEDIDIAFSNRLTQGERKKLKNITIAGISRELQMPIADWENARSRRDYNCYTFTYNPLEGYVPESLIQGVKMEISLGSISFPTVKLSVDSFVYQYLLRDNQDIIEEYNLQPFEMKVQSLERTLADKVFALCDYYLTGKILRHSRHLYDIYMLLPHIKQDVKYKELVNEIRKSRAAMGTGICPSAQEGVEIPKILEEIISKEIYKKDYEVITVYFQNHPVSYETVITALETIAKSDIFA